MNPYPRPFDKKDFPVIPDLAVAKPKEAKEHTAHVPIEAQSSLKVGQKDAFVTELWIESRADKDKRSASLHNYPAKALDEAPAAEGEHFSFLPLLDLVDVKWKVLLPSKVTKATLELWSAEIKDKALWTREVNGEALRNSEGDDVTGSLAWDAVSIDGDAERFPGKCPNVAFAPYQLRLTVESELGSKSAAWTYFDVLVHSIELHWGDQPMIEAAPIADVLPVYQPLTDRDEKALLAGLLRAPGPGIDPMADLQIALKSVNAAYVHLNEWYMWRDFAFLRYKGRWGAGPRLPIVADIFLKSLQKAEGVHSEEAAKALGPVEFLWDWRDKTEALRQGEMAAFEPAASAFVMRALKYKENAAGEPPGCLNCHADRGGKRGGPARVLPEFSDAAKFPFPVVKPGTRTWGAISKALTKAPHACSTGVLFQPSRMANDSYQLRVFLAAGRYKATLDVAGTMDSLVAEHPGLPTANTAMMEVLRQVDAQYIRKGTQTPRADLNAVASEYGKGGIRVVWTEPTWTKAEFDNCLNAALTPDAVLPGGARAPGIGEDLGSVRHKIYQTNAVARRKGLTAWKIASGSTLDSPVKGVLANYDHWFGCKKPQVAAAESAANFTLPGRDEVEAPYIDAAIDAYIRGVHRRAKPVGPNEKPKNPYSADAVRGVDYKEMGRVTNDKAKKWRKFKSQNPTVLDPALRLRFINEVLTGAERMKVTADLALRLEADGWKGGDIPRDRPEEWASANYNYRSSKLVYVAEEMHLRKVLADAFEGVTVFHYQHFLDTLNADGSVYARQCAIGGVAAISMNSDLGLSGAFLVWDHPTNLQRQVLARMLCERRGTAAEGADNHTGENHAECTFKDGNATIVHEFGHFLHLPHATPTGGADEARMHDQGDLKCIMNYDPDALHLCGGCLLRLKGWAFFQSKGQQGFDSTSPDAPGCAPPDPTTAGLPKLFTSFYADFA